MFAAGCDDFLEELPQSSAASANFYKNDNDVKNAVNACYANLQKSQLYGEFMINMAETRSDNIEDKTRAEMPAATITSTNSPPAPTMPQSPPYGNTPIIQSCVATP